MYCSECGGEYGRKLVFYVYENPKPPYGGCRLFCVDCIALMFTRHVFVQRASAQ